MTSLRNALNRYALSIAEPLIPVLKQSTFRETGNITPEEFIAAGDFLVFHFPTWTWASGEPSKARDFLPSDKQYLCTRNVPCMNRVQVVTSHKTDYESIVEKESDGGWVDTHHYAPEANKEEEAIFIPDQDNKTPQNESEDDEEPVDMDDFLQTGMLDNEDPSAVCQRIVKNPQHKVKPDGIIRTRTYDLYITYDKYYQTCRLWLKGYNEDKEPLTEAQMFEDFSQDHAKKTVTSELHPHFTDVRMPSIHPCKQAGVMKSLISAAFDETDALLGVCQYIMIFLKFVSAVIPTIEYDYTSNFDTCQK